MYLSDNRRKQLKFGTDKLRDRNLSEKRFHCLKCDKIFRDNYGLMQHNNGKYHNRRYTRYKCPFNGCNFITIGTTQLEIHKRRKKHIKDMENMMNLNY